MYEYGYVYGEGSVHGYVHGMVMKQEGEAVLVHEMMRMVVVVMCMVQ